jgi:hypothetical protein
LSNVLTMPRSARLRIDQVLECAVVLNWDDFTALRSPSLIHIEYDRTTARTLARVKVWSSTTRGSWLLICEYRRDPEGGLAPGVSFGKGFASAGLATMLDAIIRNQDACADAPGAFRNGLVQVGPPSPEARAAAASMMRDFSTPRLADA